MSRATSDPRLGYQPPASCSPHKARVLRSAFEHLIPGRVVGFHELGVDLVMGERQGYRFKDVDGQEYLDFHLNGGVFTLGHRNSELVAILRASLDSLDIGNHHFPSAARADLAETLARVAPADLPYTVFSSGGSEAIDVAIKSARYATQRRKIVALDVAYHGRTGLSGSAGDDATAAFFHSDHPAEFLKTPFEDTVALESLLRREDVAAVIIETIPATYGFITPSLKYLPRIKELCERYGSLFIADEIQAGLGRTGHMWAVSVWNVKPDILVTAKGLSGGLYPIAATLLSRRVGSWLAENGWGHVSSYGGAEVGCAVAKRVLELCSDPKHLAHALEISDHLGAGLADIQSRHPYLCAIHRQGLVMGLQFDNPRGGVDMMKALYDRGLWAIFAGFNSSILQFKPGFLVDQAYCDEALGLVEDAIRVAERQPKGHAVRLVSGGRSVAGSL
jgi:acetylornithine/succinyldiaminopimelate/putrescine aminotransferase